MSTSTLPTGRSDARFETSAAMAEAEASTDRLSKEVQQNAAQVHTAAVDAAHTAEEKETRSGTAVEQLEEGLSRKTDIAAAQGAADVASLTATATGYVDQAKMLAGNAIASVQTYMSSGTAPQTEKSIGGASGTMDGGLSTTVQTAVATGKEYLASAQATAQPYVASVTAAAQPHFDKARTAVTGAMGSTGIASTNPSAPPASTAPLESGPHIVGAPYTATTTSQTTKGGE